MRLPSPLLPALVLLSLLVSAAARAAPLFCYWIESSSTATASKALGQDGRVREFRSDGDSSFDQIIRSLERADPSGDAIPLGLMTRLRTLTAAASKGPYSNAAGTRSIRMGPHHRVACLVPGTGPRPATVILEDCHNSTHVNAAAAAEELMSHLTDLIATGLDRSGSLDMRSLLQALAPCAPS